MLAMFNEVHWTNLGRQRFVILLYLVVLNRNGMLRRLSQYIVYNNNIANSSLLSHKVYFIRDLVIPIPHVAR
jgi:hypothetical protein